IEASGHDLHSPFAWAQVCLCPWQELRKFTHLCSIARRSINHNQIWLRSVSSLLHLANVVKQKLPPQLWPLSHFQHSKQIDGHHGRKPTSLTAPAEPWKSRAVAPGRVSGCR